MALKILSRAEQVAEYLKSELLQGRWGKSMPGAQALKAQLGTSHSTIHEALIQLEAEGLLIPQGAGKCRRIERPKNQPLPSLRIAIFLYEPDDRTVDYLLGLLHQLCEAGHTAFFTSKTLVELNMDRKKVADFVSDNEADAWVVVAGSRSVLDWFAAQEFPVFGLFGRIATLPIASTSPKKIPALREVVHRLAELGHQRIVFITRSERRKPVPGFLEQTFLNELEAQGVTTGPYNLPDWEETREGFSRLLDSLFKHTPPTALLIDTSLLTIATLQHFTTLGIQSPRDVSLISMDPDPGYAWCHPVISHIAFDSQPWINHISRWANNIARGKEDHSQLTPLAKFIEGGTIGPVPEKK